MGELVDEREVARDGEDPGVEARPAAAVDRSGRRDGCGSKSPMPILGRLGDGVEPGAGSSRSLRDDAAAFQDLFAYDQRNERLGATDVDR
jgi:hypothetical protein